MFGPNKYPEPFRGKAEWICPPTLPVNHICIIMEWGDDLSEAQEKKSQNHL